MPGRTKNPEDAASQDTNMQDAPPSAQPGENQDAAMEDDAQADEEEEEEEVEAQRVKILPGSTDSAASFEFIDEGHTLGNALRYVIMKNPDVEFCAYAIPHPSEPKMNIRIQTYEGTAVDALKKGLIDLQDVCDVVADEFWTKRNAFNAQHGLTR
ncbi:RNA polymerase rpb3/Rpb11 domain-containing protein [Hirsutella rhossiliensis]|uniref:DNA-directed RNA polymerases I and III subunit RPAC2 n=1 Tax=Hirsutella rhossiliensis TaxID=111463 RepID=A0A9P8SHR2_9HYPO|nr:RNA polymerase rpb3/Rpb11 domain-containing protein [Hirsutella rhossiliensis]KAH0963061.1 RNA polymerase rpb3/Rpb11 domain-containing protein [Hirsutella rhossiliensis]